MKSNEEYLKDFHQKQEDLTVKGELWRLRVTEEEFLTEIEKIRTYEIENKKNNHLNEYHIQRNVEGMIAIMLMDIVTFEEAKDQTNRLTKSSEEDFAKDAPEIQKRLKLIQTPLSFRDTANMYRWLL